MLHLHITIALGESQCLLVVLLGLPEVTTAGGDVAEIPYDPRAGPGRANRRAGRESAPEVLLGPRQVAAAVDHTGQTLPGRRDARLVPMALVKGLGLPEALL